MLNSKFPVESLSELKLKSSETCTEFLTDIRWRPRRSGTLEL